VAYTEERPVVSALGDGESKRIISKVWLAVWPRYHKPRECKTDRVERLRVVESDRGLAKHGGTMRVSAGPEVFMSTDWEQPCLRWASEKVLVLPQMLASILQCEDSSVEGRSGCGYS